MKRNISLAVIVFLLVAVSGIALLAQSGTDDQGKPNNPATNPQANACYTGGSLQGICDTQQEWECGWVLIRVEYGLLPRSVLSQTCLSMTTAPAVSIATATPHILCTGDDICGGETGPIFTLTPASTSVTSIPPTPVTQAASATPHIMHCTSDEGEDAC